MYKIGDKIYFKGCRTYCECISCLNFEEDTCVGHHQGLLDSDGGLSGIVVGTCADDDLDVLLLNGKKIWVNPNVVIKKYDDKFEEHKKRLLNA